ncbi:MAG: trigger factor [Candidatus Omnitrophota bacterium]
MKIDIKKIDACVRELNIEVPPETVKTKLDEIYEKMSKTAKIPGFRPGAIPRNILEERHGKLAQEELVRTLVPEVYEKSMDEQGLVACAGADISDVSLENNVLKFKAKVEVKPEITLKKYKAISIKRKEPQVKEEDIAKQIEALAKERDRKGDLTDNFAKSLGYKSLEELKETLRKQNFLHSQEESYQDALNQVLDELIKDNPINVPPSLVKQQLERRIQEAKYRMRTYGAKEEEVQLKIKEITSQMEKACEREVRIFLLLEEIAKKENIKVEDESKLTQRAIEFLLEHAEWS